MKTIGIVGGLSWYSTAGYYRVINERVQERRGGHASASIALQSVDFSEVRACQLAGDWDEAGRLLARAAQATTRAGADLVIVASNLMHKVAEQVQAAVDVPLLHVTDAIAARAAREGWESVGVLGSRWVMEEDFYLGRLAAAGIKTVVPTPDERTEVDRIVFDELTQGRVLEPSRATYVGIAESMAGQGAEAIVLGCTEIELLLRPQDTHVRLLDSMQVHAEAAADAALR